MKSVIPLSLIFALASAPSIASTSEVTLTGTLTPSACTPLLGNGGGVDYGRVATGDLEDQDATFYKLPAKQLSLNIHCGGSTLFALTTTDNRHDSADLSDTSHGLGMHKGQKVGSMVLSISNPEVDGTSRHILLSFDGGHLWFSGSELKYFSPSQKMPLNRLAVGDRSTPITPIPATHLTANLDINSYISKSLPSNDDIQIDGSTTFNIVYL